MRKLMVMAAIAVMLVAGGASLADPGPNGSNNWGLCNAYSHNSDQGKANGAAFVALEATATAWDAQEDQSTDGDGMSTEENGETTGQKVAEYCQANGQKP